nr:reverse transcriptase domain-containing protein [Tanacetum cinerariifolium]
MGTFRETLAEGEEGQARHIKCYNCNGISHIARNCTQPKRPQNLEYFKDKMVLMQAQENGIVLDEEQFLFTTGGQDNVVDKDVDEPPVQDLALNVDDVFQADEYLVYDEAGPSYDSDILSEVHDHDNYQDAVCELHEVHEMHDNVHPNCVVDSDADYTSDSNMILYVKDNTEPIVQKNDCYKDFLSACPHHGFTELHQLDTFYNALNPADQVSLNSAVGGNLLERRTQDVLTIIENKSKVRNSRNKSIVSQVISSDVNSSSSSEITKLTHAVNQQTSAEDERVEETLTNPKLAEYTIKVLPPLVQKAKPPSLRNYVVHQMDPRHPHIPYPLRMYQEKQQEKDEIQIHKF